MNSELCKIAVKGVASPEHGHVWTPGRGWPVGSETIVTVVDAEDDPPAPLELTANKHGDVRHPSMIGKATLRELEKHRQLQIRVIEGDAPTPPAVDVVAGLTARAEMAEAKVKELETNLEHVKGVNEGHGRAREGMAEKIRNLEAQIANAPKSAPSQPSQGNRNR